MSWPVDPAMVYPYIVGLASGALTVRLCLRAKDREPSKRQLARWRIAPVLPIGLGDVEYCAKRVPWTPWPFAYTDKPATRYDYPEKYALVSPRCWVREEDGLPAPHALAWKLDRAVQAHAAILSQRRALREGENAK